MGLLDVVGQPTGLSTNGPSLTTHPSLHVGGGLPNPLPHNAATISSLRDSLIVARSAVEDHAAQVVQVPESQIHDILDKLKALEDEVSALLDGNEYTTASEDEASDRPPSPEANKDAVPARQKFVADENEKNETADGDAAEDNFKNGGQYTNAQTRIVLNPTLTRLLQTNQLTRPGRRSPSRCPSAPACSRRTRPRRPPRILPRP
jgi:hypothetical protein